MDPAGWCGTGRISLPDRPLLAWVAKIVIVTRPLGLTCDGTSHRALSFTHGYTKLVCRVYWVAPDGPYRLYCPGRLPRTAFTPFLSPSWAGTVPAVIRVRKATVSVSQGDFGRVRGSELSLDGSVRCDPIN